MRRNEFNANEIGKKLKAVRLRLKVKQKEMAEAVQIQPSYLCAIESGKINPGPDIIVRIASTYKINLNYLFLNEPGMFIKKNDEIVEINLSEEVDSLEKFIWLFENSVHVRSLLINTLNRALYTDMDIVIRDIERKKAKEKKEAQEEVEDDVEEEKVED
jgi:transcriptional regulator with XRE-family HTH domain